MMTRETKAQMEEYSPVRESRSWNQSKIVLRFRDDKITENEDSTKSVVTPKTIPFAQMRGGWYQNQIICYNFY